MARLEVCERRRFISYTSVQKLYKSLKRNARLLCQLVSEVSSVTLPELRPSHVLSGFYHPTRNIWRIISHDILAVSQDGTDADIHLSCTSKVRRISRSGVAHR